MIGVGLTVDGTLGRDDGIMRGALEALAAEVSRLRNEPLDERRQVRAGGEISARLAAGEDIVAAIVSALELPPAANMDRALEARCRALAAVSVQHHFSPYDDVAPALAWLAERNIPRAILTEGWSGSERAKAAAVGFGAAVLVAEDLEAAPWSPRSFAALAEALSLPTDRIWFVGSDPIRHIRPAFAVALQTVWLNRNHAPLADDRGPAQAVIESLSELPQLLAEPYSRSLLGMRYVMRTALNWRPGHFIERIPNSLTESEN